MEFWEGAVLVVGGVWLVGRMSRQSAGHPVNALRSVPVDIAIASGQGTTVGTNTDGSSFLTAGEPLSDAGGDSVSLPRVPQPMPRGIMPVHLPMQPTTPTVAHDGSVTPPPRIVSSPVTPVARPPVRQTPAAPARRYSVVAMATGARTGKVGMIQL